MRMFARSLTDSFEFGILSAPVRDVEQPDDASWVYKYLGTGPCSLRMKIQIQAMHRIIVARCRGSTHHC